VRKPAAAGKKIILGRVSGVFGVKGWIKVWSFTDPLERLLEYRFWALNMPGSGWREVEVDAGQRQGKGLIAHLVGCDDRDLARQFVQAEIAVPEAAMPGLPAGEFYWYQIEGLRVVAATGAQTKLLGRVSHLLETGANDVLVVQPCEGSIDGRERMLPWVDGKVILGVDLSAGEIRVDWDPTF
jgi:16S rRNA processing protein RimM